MAAEQVGQRLRRERSVWRNGILLSLLIHLLVFLIFRTQPERLLPYAAAGPAAGDPVAAPGGGSMRAVVVRPQTEIQIPKRPEAPVIKPVEVRIPQEPLLSLSDLQQPDLGRGDQKGPDTGPGLPGGEGGGDAGNAMEGLRRLVPPAPRGAIMTPLAHRPQSLRGREVTVWVSCIRSSIRMRHSRDSRVAFQFWRSEAWPNRSNRITFSPCLESS